MTETSNDEITLFIRDEQTARYAFNAKALRALGIDPDAARDRGYPIEQREAPAPSLAA